MIRFRRDVPLDFLYSVLTSLFSIFILFFLFLLCFTVPHTIFKIECLGFLGQMYVPAKIIASLQIGEAPVECIAYWMTPSQKQEMMGKATHSEANPQKLSALVLDYSVPIAIRIKKSKDDQFHLYWSAERKFDPYVPLEIIGDTSLDILQKVEKNPVVRTTLEERPSDSKKTSNILDIYEKYKEAQYEVDRECKS